MSNVQLNVWIDKKYKDQLEQWKQQTNKPGMNIIIEELIEAEMARQSGKVIEQESLPVIREIVRSEIQEATAQLRRELRLDREIEQTALRDHLRKGFDRLAALTIHSIRNSGIGLRLTYTALAKASTPEFAKKAHNDAREKEHLLLTRKDKPTSSEGEL
jgi:hypothetical protein